MFYFIIVQGRLNEDYVLLFYLIIVQERLTKDYVLLFYFIIVQERLTKQIAVAITEAIQPAGVGVVVEAT